MADRQGAGANKDRDEVQGGNAHQGGMGREDDDRTHGTQGGHRAQSTPSQSEGGARRDAPTDADDARYRQRTHGADEEENDQYRAMPTGPGTGTGVSAARGQGDGVATDSASDRTGAQPGGTDGFADRDRAREGGMQAAGGDAGERGREVDPSRDSDQQGDRGGQGGYGGSSGFEQDTQFMREQRPPRGEVY